MVSVLVVYIMKYTFGVPVVAMVSWIWVLSRNPVNYVRVVGVNSNIGNTRSY